MTVFERFKERKLVQWALAYLAGAWLAIEVFSTLREGLGWPAGLFPAFLALVIVGFPVARVLAWYHGEKGRQRVSAPELLLIAGLLLVAALLAPRLLGPDDATVVEASTAGADAGSTPGASPGAAEDPLADPPGVPSVAVLPFENLSGEEEDRHFVDGLHDELLTQLGRIGSLQLKSRTSVLAYRTRPGTCERSAGSCVRDTYWRAAYADRAIRSA